MQGEGAHFKQAGFCSDTLIWPKSSFYINARVSVLKEFGLMVQAYSAQCYAQAKKVIGQ